MPVAHLPQHTSLIFQQQRECLVEYMGFVTQAAERAHNRRHVQKNFFVFILMHLLRGDSYDISQKSIVFLAYLRQRPRQSGHIPQCQFFQQLQRETGHGEIKERFERQLVDVEFSHRGKHAHQIPRLHLVEAVQDNLQHRLYSSSGLRYFLLGVHNPSERAQRILKLHSIGHLGELRVDGPEEVDRVRQLHLQFPDVVQEPTDILGRKLLRCPEHTQGLRDELPVPRISPDVLIEASVQLGQVHDRIDNDLDTGALAAVHFVHLVPNVDT
mmetsp:Transcript_33588/g.96352  ORF Transcript_33588/g.96352 Transcript_33588/m.96352 type:complete len:270 (+) Transcript_33588:415-1224(+)